MSLMQQINDPGNLGQGDNIVSLFNIITSDGKQLKDVSKKSYHAITFTESMGLLRGDPQFISGEVTIIDAIDLINEMNFVGGEIIQLKFKTPQKEIIDFTGKVYNIAITDFEKKRALSLKFCSAEKITSELTKLNGAYKNIPYSSIATNIFNNSFKTVGTNKNISVEPTKNKGNFLVNNRSPIDVINQLTRAAKSQAYMGANYVFFESGENFHFVSVESLVDPTKVEPSIIYYYGAPGPGVGNIERLVDIKSYNVISMPNLIASIERGMYGSMSICNDLMKRKVTYRKFNYDEEFNKTKHVNFNLVGGGVTTIISDPIYSTSPDSHVAFVPTHFDQFDDTDTTHGEEVCDNLLRRTSQLQQMNAIQLEITVSGDTNRKVGEIVEVRLPAIEEQNEEGGGGRLDRMLSGNYLIAKLKHSILSDGNNKFNTHIRLVKDTFANPLPTNVELHDSYVDGVRIKA